MFKIEDLYCGYGEKIILKGLSLKIKDSEFAGIIGPNGSGKTTLFRAMTKIITPAKGRILFKDSDLKKISYKELSKEVAVVSQDINALTSGMTVEEFVLLGRMPHRKSLQFFEDEHDVEAGIKAMGLTNIAPLSKRFINELSSGELQRVCVARALAQEPKVLLLDEPTAHLDIGHQIELMELLKELNKKAQLTVISIFHDLNLASSYCSRLVLMNEGNIFLEGTAEEVLTYQNIEKVYKSVVVVEKSAVTKKPYVFVAPKE